MYSTSVGFGAFCVSLILSFWLFWYGLIAIERRGRNFGLVVIASAIVLPPLGTLLFAISAILPQ